MSDANEFSRRNFFAGAGAVAGTLAGGYAALAPSLASAATNTRSFGSVAIAVEIDGVFAGFAISAEGGGMEGSEAVDVPGEKKFLARPGSFRGTPLKLQFRSMQGGARFAEWFAARDLVPRNVSVILLDQAGSTELYRLVMNDARIIEVGMTEPNAATGTPVNFEAVLFAESSQHVYGESRLKLQGVVQKAKPGATRVGLFFKGLEQSAPAIVKLNSFATRARSDATGSSFGGGWVVDPLRFVVRFDSAGGYYQWLADSLRGPGADRPGVLQLLSVDARVLGTIDLIGPRVVSASTPFGVMGTGSPVVEVQVACSDCKLNVAGMIA